MAAPKISQTTADLSLLGRRDAFHVPGVLVSAAKGIISPGADVCFTDTSLTKVEGCLREFRQAIVDPFVTEILPGSLFWVFLIPDLASNLVHHFEVNLPTKAVVDYRVDWVDDEEQDDCVGCYGE